MAIIKRGDIHSDPICDTADGETGYAALAVLFLTKKPDDDSDPRRLVLELKDAGTKEPFFIGLATFELAMIIGTIMGNQDLHDIMDKALIASKTEFQAEARQAAVKHIADAKRKMH